MNPEKGRMTKENTKTAATEKNKAFLFVGVELMNCHGNGMWNLGCFVEH
jgi:hypothetical protein